MAVRTIMAKLGKNVTSNLSSGRNRSASAESSSSSDTGNKTSGQERSDRQDTLERKAKSVLHAVDPELAQRIKTLQRTNNATGTRKQSSATPIPASQSEIIDNDVLYTLGIVSSATRSTDIIQGLKTLNVLDANNTILRNPTHTESIIEAMKKLTFSDKRGLTPAEISGVQALLISVDERLSELGGDLSALPKEQRVNYLFYAGHAPSPGVSEAMMLDLQVFGVLNKNLLPLNGGPAFQAYFEHQSKNLRMTFPEAPQSQRILEFERLRTLLFPLPRYTHRDTLPQKPIPSLSSIPKSERPQWPFFAGLARTPYESNRLMLSLQRYDVLDEKFLPLDGGRAFEKFRKDAIRTAEIQLDSLMPMSDVELNLAALRDALFPPPIYRQTAPAPAEPATDLVEKLFRK